MPKFIDLTGQRFTELTVQRPAEVKVRNRPAWVCICDCGGQKTVAGHSLRAGEVKCCGKHKTKRAIEMLSARSKIANRKYPKGSDSHSRLYTLWRAMLMRCENPSHEAYGRYGGAGIKVCSAWRKYAGFMVWALASGYDNTLTIDREDNGGDYCPENCRWATRYEQERNKKQPLITLVAFGEEKPLADWALDPRCCVSYYTLHKRIAAGQPAEFAITKQSTRAKTRPSGSCAES